MPTPPNKHRTYCKNCQDFTIHTWKDLLRCDYCNFEDTGYNLNDVAPELIAQQRERYKKFKQKEMLGLYGAFIQGNGIQTMVDLDKPKIIESPAGQDKIDEKRKEQRLLVAQEAQKQLDDYNDNYKHSNRNDKCSCGSNKKFKQCHLLIFREKGLNI